MKFPLAASPFPPLVLSEQDKRDIADIADKILGATLAAYEVKLTQQGGKVDLERWKPIRRRENLIAYEDRCALAVAMAESTAAASKLSETSSKTSEMSEDPMAVPPPSFNKQPVQRMLWHGTVDCELEDMMLGVVNQTADHWQIRSSYVEDNLLDFAVLGSIVKATPAKPFQGLQIKWAVNNVAPFIGANFIRNRDFVYLDYTGIVVSSVTGERIGFQIVHSIELPGVPSLPDYKLVRGVMTEYQLFRQKSRGVVEVYARALYDLKGEVPTSMSLNFTADAVNFLQLATIVQRKRKVMHFLYASDDQQKIGNVFQDCCSVCTKELSKNPLLSFSVKTCRACANRICSRCRIPKKLSFLNRRSRSVVRRTLDCCTRCVHTAVQMDATQVAIEELRMDNPVAVFYEGAAVRSTRSMSSVGE